ncbi:MAG: hypothetical protein QOF50_692 [Gaiellaceae bacterium]|jgi:hypothetical protein|nr:hypothetical protein [Gaiellaceae bacterium]
MRRLLTFCALVALALPAAIHAASSVGAADGTVAIKNATGVVLIDAKGVIIGHADKARITITDDDRSDGRIIVIGAKKTAISPGKTLYVGEDVRFKLLGGDNVLFIRGSGISLSTVGEGRVTLDGGSVANDGKYSIDDGPFKSLPDTWQTFSFGG